MPWNERLLSTCFWSSRRFDVDFYYSVSLWEIFVQDLPATRKYVRQSLQVCWGEYVQEPPISTLKMVYLK